MDLAIVIVTWNSLDYLKKSLQSIVQSKPRVSYELIIVDNASVDGTQEWLRSSQAREFVGSSVVPFKAILNHENLGFSKANNLGTCNSGAEFVFFLNPDTEIFEGAIDALVSALRADPRVGAAGPKLVGSDGALQPSVGQNLPPAIHLAITVSGLYKIIPRRWRGRLLMGEFWDHAMRREVGYICGAAIMAKSSMIRQIGGFDERFHMYGEDCEWCSRVKRNSWKIIFEPAAVVKHYGGASTAKRWNSMDVVQAMTVGSIQFERCTRGFVTFVAGLIVRYLCTNVVRFRRRYSESQKREFAAKSALYRNAISNAIRERLL